MTPLLVAAHEAQKFFRRKRWRFCIIGGLAVIRWGEPRATQDVDITVLAELGKEEKIVDGLLAQFEGRIPDARAFALENRVLLCEASNGVSLDVSLAAFPFEEGLIARASKFQFAPRVSLVTVSAEDLLILKAIANRDKDWADVRGVITRQRERLDWEHILRELAALCELKEDTGPLERLMVIRDEEEQHEE